mmetsp:Transcript_1742/g.2944  ORF Transcript_1742/g.2944 Transcript_1742/m.2944 type:complete len:118 (+) Transcript_1742:564-917(+)
MRSMDYIMSTNAIDISYVTGYGKKTRGADANRVVSLRQILCWTSHGSPGLGQRGEHRQLECPVPSKGEFSERETSKMRSLMLAIGYYGTVDTWEIVNGPCLGSCQVMLPILSTTQVQ